MNKFIVCMLSVLVAFNTYVYTYVYAIDDILIEDDPVSITEEDPVTAPEEDPVTAPEEDPVTASEEDPVIASEEDHVTVSEDVPVSTPEEDPVYTLSDNQLLIDILNTNKEIRDNVKNLNEYIVNSSVSDCVLSNNSISDNLVDKPLSEYDLKESLLLFNLLFGVGGALVYIIHKSIFKWG